MVIYGGDGEAKWSSDVKGKEKGFTDDKWELDHEGWFWLELREDGKLKMYETKKGIVFNGID